MGRLIWSHNPHCWKSHVTAHIIKCVEAYNFSQGLDSLMVEDFNTPDEIHVYRGSSLSAHALLNLLS